MEGHFRVEYISYTDIVGKIDSIKKGDILYVISDVLELAKTARINGERFDAQKFLCTLMEKVGKEGTVLLPVFNWDFCNGEPFDYKHTLGKTGALGNAALKNNNFIRTRHPIYSFAVWGKHQDELYSITTEDCFGKGTVFDYLYKKKAKAFVIGLNALEALTMVHYVEQMVGVSYRYFKEFEGIYRDGTDEHIQKVVMYVRNLDINPQEEMGHLSQILEDLNVSNTQIVNGIPFRTVWLEQACQLVKIDIELNNSKNLYHFKEQEG